tara:strand:+ start:821 stop:1087 length:267 start_codon:yes stop_codon:yes gene_type:complete
MKEKQCDIEGHSVEGIRDQLSRTADRIDLRHSALAYDALGLIQQMEREIQELKKDLSNLTRYDVGEEGNWPHSEGDWISFEDVQYILH